MANDKINVNMFGTFSLSRGNVTVDLTKLLGKQLINLFQLLLLQKGVVISKNNIIDILYPDSENPNSVVKFSIFRLRKDLKASGIFNYVNFIYKCGNTNYIDRIKKDYEFKIVIFN